MGYPAVLLGLLGRACAIILGQMNRGGSECISAKQFLNLRAQQTLS
jgi:hypothetical protein